MPVYAGQRVTPSVLAGAADLAGLTTGSITNSTTETTIGTFSSGYPGGDGGVNSGYLFRITGTFDTTSTPTLQLILYMASVASGNRIFELGAAATGGTATAQPWWIDAWLMITATGVSGTFDGAGNFYGSNISGEKPSAFTASAIDTTATHDILLTAKWSAASSSNTCRTTGGLMSKM